MAGAEGRDDDWSSASAPPLASIHDRLRRVAGDLGCRHNSASLDSMTTASEREQACSRFDKARLGYITVYDDGTERVCFLHDRDGVEIFASRCGMSPLFIYAVENGIELLTRH